MSNWTGGTTTGHPDALTTMRCRWQLCTAWVPNRFYDADIHLCRDHAIYVWATINQQHTNGNPPTPTPQPPRTPNTDIGCVYYIRTGGLIKIGHSTRIEARLTTYPPDMELLYVKTGSRTDETTEHRRFRPYLAEGREWFQDRPEVHTLIEELRQADPTWQRHVDLDYVRRRTRTTPDVRVSHLTSSNP